MSIEKSSDLAFSFFTTEYTEQVQKFGMFRKYTFQTCFTSQTFQTYFQCGLCAERKLGISVPLVVEKKCLTPRQFCRGTHFALDLRGEKWYHTFVLKQEKELL